MNPRDCSCSMGQTHNGLYPIETVEALSALLREHSAEFEKQHSESRSRTLVSSDTGLLLLRCVTVKRGLMIACAAKDGDRLAVLSQVVRVNEAGQVEVEVRSGNDSWQHSYALVFPDGDTSLPPLDIMPELINWNTFQAVSACTAQVFGVTIWGILRGCWYALMNLQDFLHCAIDVLGPTVQQVLAFRQCLQGWGVGVAAPPTQP